MEPITIGEKFKNQLQNIWKNNWEKDFLVDFKYQPMFPGVIKNNSILFIGLNPSLRVKDEKKENSNDPRNIFYYSPYDKIAEDDQYFKIFHQLGSSLGESWSYLDLLYLRKTEQGDIRKLCYSKEGAPFVWSQLQVVKGIIEKIQPKVIVVTNSLARTLLGFEKDIEKNENEWMGLDFTIKNINEDELGTPTWNGTPVFFTSMLSGQGALDKGSFERLKWHIHYVLKKLN